MLLDLSQVIRLGTAGQTEDVVVVVGVVGDVVIDQDIPGQTGGLANVSNIMVRLREEDGEVRVRQGLVLINIRPILVVNGRISCHCLMVSLLVVLITHHH